MQRRRGSMGQVTIRFPDATEKTLRKKAKAKGLKFRTYLKQCIYLQAGVDELPKL